VLLGFELVAVDPTPTPMGFEHLGSAPHEEAENEGPDEDFRIDLAHRRYDTEGDVEVVLDSVLERLGTRITR
jgi:hypothetical protein